METWRYLRRKHEKNERDERERSESICPKKCADAQFSVHCPKNEAEK
jgi:hypothetical protein